MYDKLSRPQIGKVRDKFDKELRVLSAFLLDVCSLPGCLLHVVEGGATCLRKQSRAWIARLVQLAFVRGHIEVRDPEYVANKLGLNFTAEHIGEAVFLGNTPKERAHPFYRIKLGLTPAGLGRLNYVTSRINAIDYILAERRKLGVADAILRSKRVQRKKARTYELNQRLKEYVPLAARRITRAPTRAFVPSPPAPVIEPPPAPRSERLRMPTPILHHVTYTQPNIESSNHTRPPADARDRDLARTGEADRASA